MWRMAVRPCIVGGTALTLVVALVTSAAAGSVGDGMLGKQDVGLAQAKVPHEATLLRSSQAAPGSCEEPESREYQGRLVSFGTSTSSLNEYVLDFASPSEAGAVFAAFQADDQATVGCGQSAASLKKTPKGVGSRRYTLAEKVTVNGQKVTTTSICVVKSAHLVLLVFVGWPGSKPTPASIAKKAVKLLS
jgi:hypothetical protein